MRAMRLLKGLGLAALAAVTLPVHAKMVKYYHVDAVGSVRVVTDGSGAVVERHDYLPFGEECTTGGCASNPALSGGEPRKYTGKERDKETGLDYFGARYYGARTGRFTAIDPVYNWNENLLDPQRWNRYSYGRNNPLRYVDPDGRDVWDATQGVANAFGSNFFGGAGRQIATTSDYATGQFWGDVLSIPVGLLETAIGVEATGGGAVGAPVSGGATLSVSAVGVAMVAQGGVAASRGAVNAGIHLAKALGEAGGPKVGSEGGPGAGRRFSETRDAARAENPNCVFCDRPTTREPGPTQSNIDHSKAKARRGNNTLENAQNTCRECNQRKGTKSSEEFLKQQ